MSRVIVTVRGGVAEIEMLSGADLKVLVIDYDADGMEADRLSKIGGKEVAATLYTPDGFPPRADQVLAFETEWQAGLAAIEEPWEED